MKTSATIIILGVSAALVNCQLSQNSTNNAFICPPNANAFCAGTSLTQNFIIRCNNRVGTPGNCNDKSVPPPAQEPIPLIPLADILPNSLAGIPPTGVKPNALCYESSPTAGDAACSLNGTVYGEGPNPNTFTVAFPSTTASLGSTQHLPGFPPYTPPPSNTTGSTSASVCSASSTTTTTTTTAAGVCSASSNTTTTTTTTGAGMVGGSSTTTAAAASATGSAAKVTVTATSTAAGAGTAAAPSGSGSGSGSSTSPSTTTTAPATSTGGAAVLKGNVAVAGGMVLAAGVFAAAFL